MRKLEKKVPRFYSQNTDREIERENREIHM